MSSLTPLPIDDVLPQVLRGLERSGQVVLRAPTGAGKTTRLPPAILDAGLAGKGCVIVLEPRRIAARTAARRVSEERGGRLGEEVGYAVRFEERAGPETRLLFVTEGILLRRLQTDPFLEGIGVVVLDEFHERNVLSDLVLGMVRRVRETVRPDLRIVVMSATLDPEPAARYLGTEEVIESQGRAWPVEIEYAAPRDRRPPAELAVWGGERVVPATAGDVLVFLPGVAEIRRAERELTDFARRHELVLLPLYGDLPPEEQDRVLAPCERRKVILSTNVAETSLTIEGVRVVVDTGTARVLRYDPATGLDRLELEPISRASADQRAGRAGRTGPGYCLRLWDAASHRVRPLFDTPEVRRVDLAGPVLQLKAWGERDLNDFPWFEAPRLEAIAQAELLLRRLGACDTAGQITLEGQRMALLPAHPRLAKLLLEGCRRGQLRNAAWLAALLSERDPFFRHPSPSPAASRERGPASRPPTRFHHSHSDVLDRLAALEAADRGAGTEFPWGVLQRGAARHIARVRDQLQRLTETLAATAESPLGSTAPGVNAAAVAAPAEPEEALLRALTAAFPDRVARRRHSGSDRGVMVGGRGVKLAPQSAVREGELFLCVEVDAAATEALVRQASLVREDWLPLHAQRSTTEVFFHPTHKGVVARRRVYYEDLLLSESPAPLPDTDEPAELLFREAVKQWEQVFPADDPRVAGWVARVQSLAQWMPELDLPRWEAEDLHAVLRDLCRGCRSFAELRQADWLTALRTRLTWDQQQALDREAPETWTVPSGSRIRLQYEPPLRKPDGQLHPRPPVLAVRIQELFGLSHTPRIAGGRVKVLLHLLAPNMRPQQVTDDLESFWSTTYHTIRKELARRYPKHAWPEDPTTAPPTTRTRRSAPRG